MLLSSIVSRETRIRREEREFRRFSVVVSSYLNSKQYVVSRLACLACSSSTVLVRSVSGFESCSSLEKIEVAKALIDLPYLDDRRSSASEAGGRSTVPSISVEGGHGIHEKS